MKWEEREGGAQGRRREERFLTWRICKLEAWSYKMVFIRNDFKHGNGTNFRCQHGSKGREGKLGLHLASNGYTTKEEN